MYSPENNQWTGVIIQGVGRRQPVWRSGTVCARNNSIYVISENRDLYHLQCEKNVLRANCLTKVDVEEDEYIVGFCGK